MLSAVEAVLPAFVAASPRPFPQRPGPPTSILVIEPWGLGDVVMTTPLLRELRARYPGARVSLLARPWALELLAGSGLVDEVIAADIPWTAFDRKYAPSRYDARAMWRLISQLRDRRFDLSLDAHADLRSNVIAYLSGAARRIGYDAGGGTRLLTDALPGPPADTLRAADWLRLVEGVDDVPAEALRYELAVTDAERERARQTLAHLGLPSEGPVVAVHPGASHRVRCLPVPLVRDVLAGLSARGFPILRIAGPDGFGADVDIPSGTPLVRPTLRELMALLSEIDLLVCADSGAMHVAAAMGTPVVAVFGSGKSEWFGPPGSGNRIIQLDPMPCRPCFDACIYASPICMDRVASATVLNAALTQLGLNTPHGFVPRTVAAHHNTEAE